MPAAYLFELEQVQNESQNQEHTGDNLGEHSQLGFTVGVLGLAHERLRRTGDSAKGAVLTGLHHNDSNQTDGTQHLNDGENDMQNVHYSSKASKDGRYSGERQAKFNKLHAAFT